MSRTGVAIDAAMFTAAIRIDGCAKADVGTFVAGDDRLRMIDEEARERRWLLVLVAQIVEFVIKGIEAVGGIPAGAAPFDGKVGLQHDLTQKRAKQNLPLLQFSKYPK